MSDPDFELPTVELPYEVASMDPMPSGDVVAQDGGILIYPHAGVDEPVQWVDDDVIRQQLLELISSYLNLVPVFGQMKAAAEGFVGEDLISGRNLAWWERVLNVAAAIPHIHGATGVMKAVGTIGHTAHRVNQAVHGNHALDATTGHH
jgi:hypothetical protein